LSRCAG